MKLNGKEVGLWTMVKDMIKLYLFEKKKYTDHEIPDINTDIVICVDTINQREALRPVIEYFGDRATIIGSNRVLVPGMPDLNDLKWQSWPFALHRLYWALFLPKYQREVYRKRFFIYYSHLGGYRFWRKAFRNGKAKYYIAANDHSGLAPIGYAAAKDAGMKTIYIQHAPVSNYFPPLRVDYALLDGEDAKKKYLGAGSTKAKIFLIGTMKYDDYLRSLKVKEKGEFIGIGVGIASNDINEILTLCKELEDHNLRFIVRFHPAVKDKTRKRFSVKNWTVSQPEVETALDFILRCHTVISADSGILLETIILKRRPINFASNGKSWDYYGFVKNGIVDGVCLSSNEVMNDLFKEFEMDKYRRNAKLYCDTLNTEEEGRSTERAISILNDVMDNQ